MRYMDPMILQHCCNQALVKAPNLGFHLGNLCAPCKKDWCISVKRASTITALDATQAREGRFFHDRFSRVSPPGGTHGVLRVESGEDLPMECRT